MTWSIVAVDPETREVGVGAATCTVGVEMVRGIVPGVGVVSAQASTNLYSRNQAVEALASMRSMPRRIDRTELAGIERPVLVVVGEKDDLAGDRFGRGEGRFERQP